MKRFFFFSCLIPVLLLHAQETSKNWVPVSIEKDNALYINLSGLSVYRGEEIYVWSLQEMSTPIKMEEVDGAIYKIRTYYHINKETKRYSIIQIIYYDEKNNVLKQYNYEHKSDIPEFKFNYPILNNSDMNKILSKCLEYVNPSFEKR